MEPTDHGSTTPDDWTPWSTPEAPPDAVGEEPAAEAAEPTTTAAPVATPPPASPPPAARRDTRAAAPTAATAAPRAGSSIGIGGIVAAVGGIAIVVGSMLETVKVALGPNQLVTTALSTNYFDTDNGKICAALGAVVLVVALATLVRPIASIIPSIVVAAG